MQSTARFQSDQTQAPLKLVDFGLELKAGSRCDGSWKGAAHAMWRMQFGIELPFQVCLDEWTPESGHGELFMPGEQADCPVTAKHVPRPPNAQKHDEPSLKFQPQQQLLSFAAPHKQPNGVNPSKRFTDIECLSGAGLCSTVASQRLFAAVRGAEHSVTALVTLVTPALGDLPLGLLCAGSAQAPEGCTRMGHRRPCSSVLDRGRIGAGLAGQPVAGRELEARQADFAVG